ncbi:hypothetical protein HAX54_018881 [Datura stramonium]|uniref:Protein transport protein sec16 n=1 Tax=Datura stramonium TaxID=4076 RepID=A0ABS8RJZ5_DATST|nr:hypothetical protein [Datura stramonium]
MLVHKCLLNMMEQLPTMGNQIIVKVILGHWPQGFLSGGSFNQQFSQPTMQQNEQKHLSSDYYGSQNTVNYSPQAFENTQQFPYAPTAGRSSAGRPPHALVTFGFGGKLIVMKDNSSFGSSSFGNQNPNGGAISVLNLMDMMLERTDSSSLVTGACDYIQTLCRNPFPGPLVGGSAGIKELNKWIDERIANSELPGMDYRKGEVLSPVSEVMKALGGNAKENLEKYSTYHNLKPTLTFTQFKSKNARTDYYVAKLFASVKRNDTQFSQYGTVAQCLQQLPSGRTVMTTASEVQSLLVSGRKKEALQCAQEGQLWGPALVLAAQLGDQQDHLCGHSACHSGQPAEVFNADSTAQSGMPIATNVAQQPAQFGANVMLDDWEENLAVITANRTKDDELVLVHLGDCLWKERSDIVAAHICYLVAEANIEPYSDSARLCLVGADHWKFPRTYASPEAIQLVYAHMLAEVGRTSDALKYCQALSKSLKTGRAPEIETLRQLTSSLEERIKTHQEGGFATNLAPAKLVVYGPRVSASQSTMAMSSLMPSASSEWAADSNRMMMHNRSVSEPDFGRTPRQDHVDSSKEASSQHTRNPVSLPPTTNQFSARSRMGVRSRYVDTFNKGGAMSPGEQTVDSHSNEQQTSGSNEDHSISAENGSIQSPVSPSPMPIQRYPSMDSIPNKGVRTTGPSPLSGQSQVTVSWS